MDYCNIYKKWLDSPNVDETTKKTLRNMSEKDIYECFSQTLKFGTGGLRALMGIGTNRLNIYSIRKNTEGYAHYVKKNIGTAYSGVVIAYDNRHSSKEFALETAKVLANHEIKTYLFESLRPTPELSFAIRYLHAFGGIVITASHNPKEYNGYKIYNYKGCQCVPRETDQIIKYIDAVKDELDVCIASDEIVHNFCTIIGDNIDEAYYQELSKIKINHIDKPHLLKVVYSPEHGTGFKPVSYMLKKKGYDLYNVNNQCTFDPDFSNTLSPNPENPIAFDEGLKIAKKIDADIILATDPDCDRVGVVVKHENNYHYLTGNQTGAILLEYILKNKYERNELTDKSIVFDTIVTSALGKKIAEFYGVTCESTLTGFKFIGDKIGEYEDSGKYQFIFGYEESYGYLLSDIVRDKDGVQSCIIICEAAAYFKTLGKTLIDVLNSIYEKYGYHEDKQISIKLEGIEGKKKINAIMDSLRKNILTNIGGINVEAVEDYLISQRIVNNTIQELSLPKSNVIKYFLKDGSFVAIRPSGTEPKLKIYLCICGPGKEQAENKIALIEQEINNLL